MRTACLQTYMRVCSDLLHRLAAGQISTCFRLTAQHAICEVLEKHIFHSLGRPFGNNREVR
jgi:hypothetical protein